ncbi:C-_U-editing enzyme APOBEC-2b isoform X2 [Gadus chalcogrammus]|uniref:C->U-editing enzyme APOBEC-2b isoform X2 n=1 Tax=Gadus chalcogrammus TaxID=1042646 RepID=UPI0024C26D5C|nr:C->U-editing enzyme APOBEC-2b isoform X2 [Gadus chalcogrammus]
MADRNTGRSSVKKKEKTTSKPLEEKEKDKTKEKAVKKSQEKPAKKTEKSPKPPAKVEEGGLEDKEKAGDGEAVGGAEAKDPGDNGDFQPIELPPFEIVTGQQMSPFYFRFQFRNVEYSSGRNKTLLCFRVDVPGADVDPLMGYMEDEHATAHAEEAFFDQWEEPETCEGLKALAGAGCKLRMMKPADFQHVWETYVEREEESFAPWEDCQDNYNYYTERLAGILK